MGCLLYFYRPVKKAPNIIRIQFIVLILGVVLMAAKFLAYLLTNSNAILSDALESIINVAAGTLALYSLYLSKKPKDSNHPYGHGKIQFISAGFEGGMIVVAAFYILFEAIISLVTPPVVKQLDLGIYLVAGSGAVNFLMGTYLVRIGKQTRTEAMVADGKHLLTDTYTSLGLVAGLALVQLTQYVWLDAVIALLMGCMILYTGYTLIRKSLAGLMDETDLEIIEELMPILNENRNPNWIDIHNLRVVKYGSDFHIDAHVTLPWYWTLEQAHDEVTALDYLATEKFYKHVELFIHADPCLPKSCPICEVANCPERKAQFVQKLPWTLDNLLKDEKHSIEG
ncbi:MAG: cation diffusion facilitator family transporter [Bacteroidetes bacterium B1(2017)]|nr:MAG: cation diffusion facilitator family transporter [Bacteroidetes bacterium B1(2017)]